MPLTRDQFAQASASFRARNPHLFPADAVPGPDKPPEDAGKAISSHPKPRQGSGQRKLNKTEQRWLGVLEERGIVARYEAIRFRLAPKTTYTPDFYGLSHNDRLTFWEVKGPFIRDRAMQKPKIAAAMFPEFDFVLAQWIGGEWKETMLPKA